MRRYKSKHVSNVQNWLINERADKPLKRNSRYLWLDKKTVVIDVHIKKTDLVCGRDSRVKNERKVDYTETKLICSLR